MGKLSIFEEFAKNGREAATKALKKTSNVSAKQAKEILKDFKGKSVKVANKLEENKISKVNGVISKEFNNVPKIVKENQNFKINNVTDNVKNVTLKNGQKVTGAVFGEGPETLKNYVGDNPLKGRGQKYNFMGKDGKTATFHNDIKYHKDFVKNNTTAYKVPSKDAPKLGEFNGNKKTYTMKDPDQINDFRGTSKTNSKEDSLLRKYVPTAVGAGIIFTMANRRGQQSNSELYGQQSPYQ